MEDYHILSVTSDTSLRYLNPLSPIIDIKAFSLISGDVSLSDIPTLFCHCRRIRRVILGPGCHTAITLIVEIYDAISIEWSEESGKEIATTGDMSAESVMRKIQIEEMMDAHNAD